MDPWTTRLERSITAAERQQHNAALSILSACLWKISFINRSNAHADEHRKEFCLNILLDYYFKGA